MLGETYPCLTIRQPWATLVMEGLKPIEFRDWPTPADVLQRIMVVHSAKRAVKREEVTGLIYKLERGGDAARGTGLVEWEACLKLLHKLLAAPGSLPHSSLLGTVRVMECLRNMAIADRLGVKFVNDSHVARPDGDGWSDRIEHSNWGWCLTDPTYFRPYIPSISGQQGIWLWTDTRRPALA